MRLTIAISVLLLPSLAVAFPGSVTTGPAATKPAKMHTPHSGTASIAIQAVQGTKGGPKVGGDTVTIELLGHGGVKLRTINAQLDEHGVATLEGLPLATPFRPKVTVKHAGVSYEAAGTVMDATHTSQKITVTVHETSDQKPDWQVKMWHIRLQPAGEGVHVSETLVVHNPADTAWLPGPDANGDRSWVVRDLPAGAREIKLAGALHSRYAKVVDGRVFNTMALTPGQSRFQLGYTLPSPEGEASVSIVTPAAVKYLMVLAPQGQAELKYEGLEPVGVMPVQGKPMQAYKAVDLPAGKKISFTLPGLPIVVANDSPEASVKMPKMLAAVGGGAILIVSLVLLLRKSAKRAGAEAAD